MGKGVVDYGEGFCPPTCEKNIRIHTVHITEVQITTEVTWDLFVNIKYNVPQT